MKVAIFGAGTMGSGIAQVFAAKGHTALMYASSVASAQKHKDKLAASLAKACGQGQDDPGGRGRIAGQRAGGGEVRLRRRRSDHRVRQGRHGHQEGAAG